MKTKIVLMALGLSLMTGCGISGGLLRDSVTMVELDSNNFKYVKKNVSAEASNSSFLCAMPGKAKLYHEAMQKLHDAAGLGDNQTFANISEDRKFTSFLFSCKTTVTLTADVVEFTK